VACFVLSIGQLDTVWLYN